MDRQQKINACVAVLILSIAWAIIFAVKGSIDQAIWSLVVGSGAFIGLAVLAEG